MAVSGRISVIGAGPAGCAAALAALAEGSAVTLYEKSRFPRHKVCGEFISPEVSTVFDALGLWPAFSAAEPARLRRAILHFGRHTKRFELPQPVLSLSRFALDQILLTESVRRGALLKNQLVRADDPRTEPTVIAHGRQARTTRSGRLFGFKAHFRGAVEDAVEMFFFRGCYVGVSPVESPAVNVCGLAPEEALRESGFQPEALFPEPLRQRLHCLERGTDWLITGPLVFRQSFASQTGAYLAGDALGFVDPFTGSGISSAMLTGRLAGQAASRGLSVESYYTECRSVLRRQYRVASTLRRLLVSGLAEHLGRWIPGQVLYRLTRPSP
jgi:menaquinone-9 beta-reductase